MLKNFLSIARELTEEGQGKVVSHLLAPVIMGIQDLVMVSKETLITHHLGDVITTEGSLSHPILNHMGEEMVLMDNMGEEMVLLVPGQVPLVLVQAGDDLSHHFKAQMVVDMYGLQEELLFAGIQNLLTRDNSLTRKTTVVVKTRTILLTLHPNVCAVGEPMVAVFVRNIHGGKVPRANSVGSCMKLDCTEHAAPPLPRRFLSLDIAEYRIMKVK